ncbi:hypothetical protein V493_00480 [Pseudogymnoascus sp. VKM F-4281 (FW-2241)]|nr:hypothetical protein V493_00480 [Pseudogymnoascus sp. VKM F-4281 (FW-2241)]
MDGSRPNDTKEPSLVEEGHTPVDPTNEKNATFGSLEKVSDSEAQEDTKPSEDAQNGVKKIEAVTLAWSKKSLAGVLILIWLVTLVNNFKATIVGSLTPFATSDWKSHSLLTVINIVANAMTAAVYIPMAKLLDVWGRAEGFLLMLCLCTLGLILMAVSKNLATYCAAQVFYSVGFGGLAYSWNVIATDVTNLRNRGLAFAFTSSPAVITAFAGSKAAEGFYNNVNWQWGIGCWAIIFPCVALPLYWILNHNLRKAEKQGIITQEKSGRTLPQQAWYILKEFDLPGVCLFAGGLVLFLLPFTLAATAPNGWKSDYIIAMIVVGIVLLGLFVLHQIYVAPSPFLKSRFLLDRTVLGACLLDATYQISYSCYASYFSSFLMVVNNLTMAEAGYVTNTFSAVAFVSLFATGYIIRVTGRFKWILWFCLPLYIFALGLMINFRQPNGYIGYIVMCEVFFSVSGAIFILCVQLAVLATVDHQYVASVLAFLFVSGTIGGAIGSAISGAIWTNTFKKALGSYLPESAMPDLQTIYASLPAQLAYKVGTPERLAIQQAYGYAQTRMLAAGCSVMVLGFIAVAMIRDINVKTMSQTKDNIPAESDNLNRRQVLERRSDIGNGKEVQRHQNLTTLVRPYFLGVMGPTGCGSDPWRGVYVLDGNALFLTATEAAWRRAASSHFAGGGIIVAIGYPLAGKLYDARRRNNDLTPPTPIPVPGYGGADAFMDFIDNKIRPAVKARFPQTSCWREAIYGHSYGGLFVLHVLFTRPQSFECYIASSPSIWWNSRCILREAKLFLEDDTSDVRLPSLMLFFGSFEQDPPQWRDETLDHYEGRKQVAAELRMRDNVLDLCEMLQDCTRLHTVSTKPYEGEEHTSVMACSMSRSLTVFFEEWPLPCK